MKKNLFCIFLFFVLYSLHSGAQNNPNILQDHVTKGYNYLVSGLYDQSEAELKAAYNIDPNQYVISNLLANLYIFKEDYSQAEFYAKNASKLNFQDNSSKDLLFKTKSLNSQNKISTIISFLLIILILYITYLLLGKEINNSSTLKKPNLSLLIMGLSSSAIVSIFYFIFFYFSRWIWDQSLKIDPMSVTPLVRSAIVPDGYEGYVLLLGSIFICFFSIIIIFIYHKSTETIKKLLILLFSALTIILLYNIKFFPPLTITTDYTFPFIKNSSFYGIYFLISFAIIALLIKLDQIKTIYACILAFIVMWIGCCINSQPFSEFDYNFILMPGLRLYHGFKLSEIYFQYDVFLSGLVYILMLLKIPIYYFQVVGQYSYIVAAFAIFFISKKMLIEKKLPIIFLILIIIFRQNTIMVDPVTIFQVTPLRLELWIFLIFTTYYFGIHHWTNGLVLGLLIFFHRNFGLLYFASYLLINFLLFVDYFMSKINESKSVKITSIFLNCLKDILLKYYLSFGIIAISVFTTIYIFGGITAESAIIYQKIGVMMMTIARNSFFWYIFILFGFSSILIFQCKKYVSINYFQTALFALTLLIVESMYFFGRSHEHNIINIASSILLLFIVIVDLTLVHIKNSNSDAKTSKLKYRIILYSPYILSVVLCIYYAPLIIDKFNLKIACVKKYGILFPQDTPDDNLAKIQELTKKSKKVYFVNTYFDFHYYYHGKYVPQCYYSPFSAWFFMDDLLKEFNRLTGDGYYIVFIKIHHSQGGFNVREIAEIVPRLKYNKYIDNEKFSIYWLEK